MFRWDTEEDSWAKETPGTAVKQTEVAEEQRWLQSSSSSSSSSSMPSTCYVFIKLPYDINIKANKGALWSFGLRQCTKTWLSVEHPHPQR
jgi:hypothetical protein